VARVPFKAKSFRISAVHLAAWVIYANSMLTIQNPAFDIGGSGEVIAVFFLLIFRAVKGC